MAVSFVDGPGHGWCDEFAYRPSAFTARRQRYTTNQMQSLVSPSVEFQEELSFMVSPCVGVALTASGYGRCRCGACERDRLNTTYVDDAVVQDLDYTKELLTISSKKYPLSGDLEAWLQW